MAARDGDVLDGPGPVRIALAGGLDEGALAQVRAVDPRVVLISDAVRRGTPAEYAALHSRVAGLPVVPIPGAADARRDRRLRRWMAAWSGLGTAQTDRPSSWRAFDVVADGQRWRVVLLDADRERLGDRFVEETFWLPRVCGGDDVPLLIVLNGSADPHGGSAPADAGARELREIVLRHADATRLVLVASFGAGEAAFTLPGGPWGEGWLAIGPERPGAAPTAWVLSLDGAHLELARADAPEAVWRWSTEDGWAGPEP